MAALTSEPPEDFTGLRARKRGASRQPPDYESGLYRTVRYDGRCFLYSGVSDRIFRLDRAAADVIDCATTEELAALEGCSLADVQAKEGALAREPEKGLREQYARAIESSLQQVVLGVTESCNLRCTYCIYSGSYENVRTHSSARMTWDVARRGLDLLFDHCSDSPMPPGVTFYGGEPLLEFPLIERCITYARERNPAAFFTLTTNGLLLSKRVRSLLVKHNVFVTVSLDGPAEIHDRYRRTEGDKPSFSVIWQHLTQLQSEEPDYFAQHVRFSTVLAPPVDQQALANFFNQIGHAVVTSPLDLHRMSEEWQLRPQTDQFTYLAEQFTSFCRRRRSGENLDPLRNFAVCSFGPGLRRIQARGEGLYRDPHRLGQCTVGARKIFVSPSGSLYPCEKVEGGADVEIGDVVGGVSVDKVDALMGRFRAIVAERCGGCWMRHMCTACLMQTVHGGFFDRDKMNYTCRARREGQAKLLGLYAYLIAEDPEVLDFLPQILPNG